MAAMLRDSVAVVAVVRTRPRAIPLAMITMRKSICGFSCLSYMNLGLRYKTLFIIMKLLVNVYTIPMRIHFR